MVLARAASTRRALPSGSCPLCFGSGRLPTTGRGAPRPVAQGAPWAWSLWCGLLLCSLEQQAGLSERGEGGALHQVLVQQPLSLAK